MTEIVVIFQTEDGNTEKTLKDILLDSQLDESRQAVQMLLGLPENPPYRLLLERTGKILRDNLTFREAGVISGDKIILVCSPNSGDLIKVPQQEISSTKKTRSLVPYILQLTIISDAQQIETYEYPIELEEFHEDNPKEFFSDSNGRERQNFVKKLQKIVSREIESYEIDKILQDWCDDISLGYRFTAVKI